VYQVPLLRKKFTSYAHAVTGQPLHRIQPWYRTLFFY